MARVVISPELREFQDHGGAYEVLVADLEAAGFPTLLQRPDAGMADPGIGHAAADVVIWLRDAAGQAAIDVALASVVAAVAKSLRDRRGRRATGVILGPDGTVLREVELPTAEAARQLDDTGAQLQ